MRLNSAQIATEHALTLGQTESDHHQIATAKKFQVNAYSIPASSSYTLTVALGQTGNRVLWAVLRGSVNIDVQGHVGCFVLGTDAAQESESIGVRPYPSGVSSYMGGYSRLHGDSYLSHGGSFGPAIRLLDAYIDGSDAKFVFENTSLSAQNLQVYGTVVVK